MRLYGALRTLRKDFATPLDALIYGWRRSSWRWAIRRLDPELGSGPLKRPIFLLGTQGGGSTIVSRMLRRHPDVVTFSGGADYWAGADEMQGALRGVLPPNLRQPTSGLRCPPGMEAFPPPHSWAYATDALLPQYRRTRQDANGRDARILQGILRLAVARHGDGERPRFTDKSQLFSVKVSLLDELLKESRPLFVLLTRNPYAACFRAAEGGAGDMARASETVPFRDRLELCLQHWGNSIRCVLEDAEDGCRVLIFRLEDFLDRPESTLKRLCELTDLEFDARMVPRAGDRIPRGSRFPTWWFPLRRSLNEGALARIPGEDLELMTSRLQSVADVLAYHSSGHGPLEVGPEGRVALLADGRGRRVGT